MPFTKKWSSALLLMAALSQSAMADPALELSVTGPETVSDVDDFTITATLKNTGDVPLDVYHDPHSVLSEARAKSYKVRAKDGSQPAFVGIALKYIINPESTPYTSIPVGGSVDVTTGLSDLYEFHAEGSYTVTPSTTFYYAGPDNRAPVRIEAHLNRVVTAKIAGNLKSRSLAKRREQRRKRDQIKRRMMGKRAISATTANCASDLAAEITQSMFHASLYSASAEKYLALHNSTTPRYETWFGEYTTENHAVALDHFKKIRESDVKTYNYDCACEDAPDPANTFAYVQPDTFGIVHLCGAFTNAEIFGADSKAGTIVHEASHFTANGATDDLAYGRPDAETLASQNATAALNNADSHEYFAENVPWLA